MGLVLVLLGSDPDVIGDEAVGKVGIAHLFLAKRLSASGEPLTYVDTRILTKFRHAHLRFVDEGRQNTTSIW